MKRSCAGSNRTAYAPIGIAWSDDSAESIPHGACGGTHSVPWQGGSGFRLLVVRRDRFFDFVECLSGIVEERIVTGAIGVLELIVRISLRVWLLGMLFPPISRFLLPIRSAGLMISVNTCCLERISISLNVVVLP